MATQGAADQHEAPMRVADVARLTGFSKVHIYRAISRGDLRAIRLGGAVRVPSDAVDRLLAGTPTTPRDTA